MIWWNRAKNASADNPFMSPRAEQKSCNLPKENVSSAERRLRYETSMNILTQPDCWEHIDTNGWLVAQARLLFPERFETIRPLWLHLQ